MMDIMENRRFEIEKMSAEGSGYYIFEPGHRSSLLAIQPSKESVLAYLAAYVGRTKDMGDTYEVWEGDQLIN